MDTNQPKFLIIGNDDNVNKVLNKLPNKNKLFNNYLYDIEYPFVEYGFYLQQEDENNYSGDFRVIVCPEKINNFDNNLFKNEYLKNITALIICHNDSNNINNINIKNVIHIYFNNNEPIDYNWLTKIYDYLDIPFTPYYDNHCNII
jgi:hypothetical protein